MRYLYSNLGYAALEHLIERLSGSPLRQFLREEVFLPLGMEHTEIVAENSSDPRLAARYGSDDRRLPFYDFDHWGASAGFSCLHDLPRFARFHLRQEHDFSGAKK